MTRVRRGGRRGRRSYEAAADAIIPVPKRPYRDSAIFYAILAVLLVVVASATGGSFLRALLFGVGFFLVATTWSWWRFRQRLARERAETADVERAEGDVERAKAESDR